MTGSAGRTAGWVVLAALAAAGAFLLLGRSEAPQPDARPVARRAPPSLLGTLPLAGSLGTVRTGFGAVWIDDRTDDRLLRVDARRGTVRASIPVRGRVAVAAGAGALWVLQNGRGHGNALTGPVLRVDPRRTRVTGRVAVRTPGGRQVLAFGILTPGRRVWIWGPRDLLRVDPRSRRVDRAIEPPAEAGEVTGAVEHGGAIVLVTADGRILRRDAATGAALGTSHTGLPLSGVRSGPPGAVVVLARGAVALADVRTGRVRWRRDLGYRIAGAEAADGLVWVLASPRGAPQDQLVGLDPATGRVSARSAIDQLGTVAMARVGRRLWLTSVAGRVVVVEP